LTQKSDALDDTERQPDWSKSKSSKPKIAMKINFGKLPEVICSDDSETDLPPVLNDPSKKSNRKTKRLFDQCYKNRVNLKILQF